MTIIQNITSMKSETNLSDSHRKNNVTSDFLFVDGVGTDPHSLYITYRKIDQIYS